MGNGTSKPPVYSIEVEKAKNRNETGVFRNSKYPDKLLNVAGDCQTAYDIFQHGLKSAPNGDCLGTRLIDDKGDAAGFEWLNYSQVNGMALDFGRGLEAKNLTPIITHEDESYEKNFRFMAIFSKNRKEWIITEQACNAFSVTLVPIYDTLGPEALSFILTQTKLQTMTCSLECFLRLEKAADLADLKNVILMDDIDKADARLNTVREKFSLSVYTMHEIIKAGKENSTISIRLPKPETVNTFCYTSGTTGTPKGAMITHAQLVSVIAGALEHPSCSINPDDVALSYLPAAHILERIVNQLFFYSGAQTGFYQGDTLKIVDDVAALRPTVFVSVPRLYNRIHDKVVGKVTSAGWLKQSLFNRALNTKKHYLRQIATVQHSLWDAIVFKKTKNVLGGRVRLMLTGSAPINAEVHENLKCIFCCPIQEGYGMTESCGASMVTVEEDTVTGHVGGPVACVEFKLVGVEDMNYLVTHKNEEGKLRPRGEICFRGPSVFPGYFREPEKTTETIDKEGWLHTGDIGELQPEKGCVKIIDRKKNIFKLSQGEYVAPEKIELAYTKSTKIAQAFVYGYSDRAFLVGIIVPDEAFAKDWASSKSLDYVDLSSVCSNKEFRSEIGEEMTRMEKENKLLGFEKLKNNFTLCAEPFTPENNLLTPTFKLKRNDAKIKFQKEIDYMYENA